MLPYGKQDINQQDIDSVIDVLKSDFLTQGPQVPLFEEKIKKITHVQHAVAVNSATSALHVACLALGLAEGDIVWTTPISFVASANCALYCKAKVDFVDIDSSSYNLCAISLEKKLAHAQKHNLPLPKIVIPVHLSGQPCDMEKIHVLSQKYGFSIIEDASHAIGGKYKNDPIGNCKYSNITIFSFHPVKIITTAEGGIATTNNINLANKMTLLRSHGITRDDSLMTEPSHGTWYYQQIVLGFNYRMTEIQAALGVSQIKRLPGFINNRNRLAKRYDDKLKGLPVVLPKQIQASYSANHLYIIRLKLRQIELSHKQVFDKLREAKIGVNLHYIPIHLQPFYKEQGFELGMFPEAEKYYQEAISIPLFQQMTNEQQDYIIDKLKRILI
jgi:UDP-4-amino-4,6-dideoxy-N-acetyl-beta-L-altrosamine transaminase